MSQDYYLKVARASDLKDAKERFLFRFFEMLPGSLSLGTIGLLVFLSWRMPEVASILIIAFVLYWFFRTVYLMFHLWAGYRQMGIHEKMNWIQKLNTETPQWKDIYHLVLVPAYEEPMDVLRQTFLGLEKSDYPKERILLVFGIEEAEGDEGERKAMLLYREFSRSFPKFLIARHPAGLANEIPGKGSNETWAAKEGVSKFVGPLRIPYEKVIVSSLDSDTVVGPAYFSCLTYRFLKSKDPLHTSFQPIPLFLNNIESAPAISRIFSFSSTFWHTMNQERPEKLVTFSSHALSLRALADVGYKQTNVVSDDSRIFWQCFLFYNGNYRVDPLFYPVSMDANVATTFASTLFNIYKQQRRWAYGAADIPYFLFGFLKNKKIPLQKKFSLGWELFEGHWTWGTAPVVLFFAGWLPLFLGGEEFSQTLLSYSLPAFTGKVLTLAALGLVTSAIISINLLPRKIYQEKWRLAFYVGQWILFPFTMIFFSALPALDAQVRLLLGRYLGFWHTPKFR